jgi:hypothetical protein
MDPHQDRVLLKKARGEKDRLEAGLSSLKCALPHDSEKMSHRYSVNTLGMMRRASCFCGLCLVLLVPAASPSSVTAQTVRGVVVDSVTAEPLGEAWITLSGPEGTVSQITGADGRFQLTVEGESPFDLTVRRIGYQERTLVVESDDVPEELRIGLAVAPFDLQGLEVEAEREGPDFRFHV